MYLEAVWEIVSKPIEVCHTEKELLELKQLLKKDRSMRRTDEEESMINIIRSSMVIMCAVPPMGNQEVRIFIGYISRSC